MKIKTLIKLCIISLCIVEIISYCISVNKNLSVNDIEKYTKDIIVEYTLRSNYGYNSYVLNINNNSVVKATKSVVKFNDNKYTEFNGYHIDKIKGVEAIYDINNKVVLDSKSITQKYGYEDFGWRLKMYDSINNLLFFLLINPSNNHSSFMVCDLSNRTFYEITKVSNKYNGKHEIAYKSYKNSIYILDENNELCEYNYDTQVLRDFKIKPKCYSITDNKIVYLDKDGIHEYNVVTTTINKLFKPEGFVTELFVNSEATFILTTEEQFWFTEVRDSLYSNPYHKNCLKMYECSTGKSKLLVSSDREHYVSTAKFLE